MSGSGLEELAAIPVESIPGLSTKVVRGLSELGVENAYDLVTYYPRRYVDRT